MSEELGTFKKVIHIPAGDVPASVISVNSATAMADRRITCLTVDSSTSLISVLRHSRNVPIFSLLGIFTACSQTPCAPAALGADGEISLGVCLRDDLPVIPLQNRNAVVRPR